MSAAAVVRAESPRFESSVSTASPEERLCELVHDLRQPLSSIESIAYYLEMILPPNQAEARRYMAELQQLVAESNTILERSVAATRKACARAASAGGR